MSSDLKIFHSNTTKVVIERCTDREGIPVRYENKYYKCSNIKEYIMINGTLNMANSPFNNGELITDVNAVNKKLPSYPKELIQGLIFERKGVEDESNMTAWGLHEVIGDSRIYQISKQNGIVPEKQEIDPECVRQLSLHLPVRSHAPAYSEVQGKWQKSIIESGEGNNILGGSGRFFTKEALLEIPVVEATEKSLSYYGATLLNDGDLVSFNIEDYPVWGMSIGEQYVDSFLMSDVGGGFYVEYHNDKPHFHMPLSIDCGGFYLLGKEISKDDTTNESVYHFTGFKIPFGKAVYTSGGTIHCDAALTGDKWLVGYTEAHDYSTVNLRCENSETMTYIEGTYTDLQDGLLA